MKFRKSDIEKICASLLLATYDYYIMMTKSEVSYNTYCETILSIVKDKTKLDDKE